MKKGYSSRSEPDRLPIAKT